jgi:hypothetical protein
MSTEKRWWLRSLIKYESEGGASNVTNFKGYLLGEHVCASTLFFRAHLLGKGADEWENAKKGFYTQPEWNPL